MENKEIVRILVIIGGIIGLIQALLGFGNYGLGFWGGLYIVSAIIGVILSIIVLLSVFRPGNPIPYNAVILIILGILLTLFSSWIGGVLVLVAGILWLVWKL